MSASAVPPAAPAAPAVPAAPAAPAAPAPADNPLRAGLVEDRQPEPCAMVIFGASGDLTRRKLLPALYTLRRERLLPPSFAVVGFARRPKTDDEFRAEMAAGIREFARLQPVDETLLAALSGDVYYVQGDFDDLAAYRTLGARLEQIDAARGTAGSRVFYLAAPPSVYPTILRQLGAAGLARRPAPGDRPFCRTIIEKPFGRDLATARALNAEARAVFDERQVFRIDHYLGKETVQNMLVLRFANGIFEPLWNQKYVDHVQITGAESIGVEGRGGYFEEAGILRDMVQNHLFQVLCLTAMEPPVAFTPDAVRDEKLKVLMSLREAGGDADGAYALEDNVVRAQYAAGNVLGQRVPGYREEAGVAAASTTETFVAMKLFVDNWRWAGVPFYLRSAKRMPKRVTEIAIHFKAAPHRLFGGDLRGAAAHNVLAVRIQPDEGISLNFGSKVPGPTNEVAPVNMEFRYGTSFGTAPPEAYERLLLDCLLGDPTLFTRGDEVEASWRWISRVHEAWAAETGAVLPAYEAGSWGPPEADALLARDGRRWRKP
ncbi:MAG TPA: glucose-6-phosphate dehydrogenase [Myxococcota bacterium]|jgi:glucose-6-phosphate 1-dehydrogenase|nr:glucose-6-phosphate dehydrogenase [Myxococcota bacterium]